VRKVGVVLVGLGLLGAAAGHYVAYTADPWADSADLGIVGAMVAICLAIVGLMLIQFRS
jgi:hypothetical protein